MIHRKGKSRLSVTTSHYRCRMANMVKSLIIYGRIETTVAKAKHLRSYAEKIVTIAKTKEPVTKERLVKAKLMLTYNKLTPKEIKDPSKKKYNNDRKIFDKLDELKARYETRNGGYTRIIRLDHQVGDGSEKCIIEFI